MVNVMSNEKLKVQCPNCKAVLTLKIGVDASADILILCPRCKVKTRLSLMQRVLRKAETEPLEEETEFEAPTLIRPDRSCMKSYLLDVKTGKKYNIKEGVHLFGRMTYKAPPLADIPIETDDMGVSRAHFYLEKKVSNRVVIYNAKNMNTTYVNSEPLESGDKMILKNGDMIITADTKLKFINE